MCLDSCFSNQEQAGMTARNIQRISVVLKIGVYVGSVTANKILQELLMYSILCSKERWNVGLGNLHIGLSRATKIWWMKWNDCDQCELYSASPTWINSLMTRHAFYWMLTAEFGVDLFISIFMSPFRYVLSEESITKSQLLLTITLQDREELMSDSIGCYVSIHDKKPNPDININVFFFTFPFSVFTSQ